MEAGKLTEWNCCVLLELYTKIKIFIEWATQFPLPPIFSEGGRMKVPKTLGEGVDLAIIVTDIAFLV